MNADLQSVATVAGTLKSALDAAQSLVSLAGTGKNREQTVKLYKEIEAAYERALTAQGAQAVLTQRTSELEAEIAKIKAQLSEREDWKCEKERYELTRLCTSYDSFAYTLKADAQVAEPAHSLCPHCFEQHKKRVLCGEGKMYGVVTLQCNDCGFAAKVRKPDNPNTSRPLSITGGRVDGWMGR